MRIYLDHNASSPLRPTVREAMIRAMDLCGNASSVHTHGRQARKALEEARNILSLAFGTPSRQIVFTSGATEANNMIVRHHKGPVIISAVEHDSIRMVREDAIICPVDNQGCINLEALKALLVEATRPALVSVMIANNETGVIQPIETIAAYVKEAGGLLHSDAVQGIGKLDNIWSDLSLDYLTLSAHKIGGPQGVGAIIYREGCPLFPLQRGGGQEGFVRPGTENLLGIVGLAAAIEDMKGDDWTFIRSLRDRLEIGLKMMNPTLHVFGQTVPRLANTSCFALPGIKKETCVMRLDLAGISVSAGAACSSGKVQVSHVLKTMQVSPQLIQSAIRISLGWNTTTQDIEGFLSTWENLYATEKHQGVPHVLCA